MSFTKRPFQAFSALTAFLILGCFAGSNLHAQVAPAVPSAESSEAPAKPARKLPTGLLKLEGFKYPVYVYVPEGIELDKKYPMLFMIPSETDSAEEQLEYILPTARSLECFVLAPSSIYPKELPYDVDKWLLKIKNEILPRFPVDPSKVYAIGRNSGAPYAAYLISAYPSDFSGAALVGEGWDGTFNALLKPRVSAGEQMPVVAAFAADQTQTKSINEKWVMKYQQAGYPVQIMTPAEGQDLNSPEFKASLLEWLDQKGQAWKLVRDEKNQSFKQRFKRGVKQFFEV